MSEFNFKSQVCTSRKQSEKLLALGLKKETADCAIFLNGDNEWEQLSRFLDWEKYADMFPAWSLHRLWCLLPNSITIEYWMYARKYTKVLDLSMDSYQNVSYAEGVVEPCHDMHFYANDAYESICKAIEWLIKEGYFNKEYLV